MRLINFLQLNAVLLKEINSFLNVNINEQPKMITQMMYKLMVLPMVKMMAHIINNPSFCQML